MPATIRAMQPSRASDAGSWNSSTPRAAVPTAPMTVQMA
jgi:hypothetical protein